MGDLLLSCLLWRPHPFPVFQAYFLNIIGNGCQANTEFDSHFLLALANMMIKLFLKLGMIRSFQEADLLPEIFACFIASLPGGRIACQVVGLLARSLGLLGGFLAERFAS